LSDGAEKDKNKQRRPEGLVTTHQHRTPKRTGRLQTKSSTSLKTVAGWKTACPRK